MSATRAASAPVGARPALLDLAGGAAPVAGDGVSVVAPLPRHHDAVAAHGRACCHPGRALWFEGARRRAPVVRNEVLVVALLAALDDAVAAHRLRAGRLGVRRRSRTRTRARSCTWRCTRRPASCCRRRTARCRRRCRRRTRRCTCSPRRGHVHPASTWQVALQPSAGPFAFPSSHGSVPATIPSPHTVVQAAPASGSVQPCSIWHVRCSRRPRCRCRRRRSRRVSTMPSPQAPARTRSAEHAPPSSASRVAGPASRAASPPAGHAATRARPGRSTLHPSPELRVAVVARLTWVDDAVAAHRRSWCTRRPSSGTSIRARSGRPRSSRRPAWCCRRRTSRRSPRRRRRTPGRRSTSPRAAVERLRRVHRVARSADEDAGRRVPLRSPVVVGGSGRVGVATRDRAAGRVRGFSPAATAAPCQETKSRKDGALYSYSREHRVPSTGRRTGPGNYSTYPRQGTEEARYRASRHYRAMRRAGAPRRAEPRLARGMSLLSALSRPYLALISPCRRCGEWGLAREPSIAYLLRWTARECFRLPPSGGRSVRRQLDLQRPPPASSWIVPGPGTRDRGERRIVRAMATRAHPRSAPQQASRHGPRHEKKVQCGEIP